MTFIYNFLFIVKKVKLFGSTLHSKMDTSKVYDVSKEEMDKIRRRAAIREQLRQEYNRKFYNPVTKQYGVFLPYPNYLRFMAAREFREEFFKPTWQKTLMFFVIYVIPPICIFSHLYKTKLEQHRKIQEGIITIQDRHDIYI